MIKNGYIKIWQELLNWPYHSDPKMMSLWVHILLLAAFSDHDWKGITIRRGQLPTTIAQLAELTGLTPKEVRLRLDILEKDKEIVKEKGENGAKKRTKNGTIITVCKYDDYQVLSSAGRAEKRAENGQRNGQKKGQQHNNRITTDIDSSAIATESNSLSMPSAEFQKFQEWIATHAAEVAKMQQPFTEEQYRTISQNYDPREVADVLEAMSNTSGLLKKYKSAYKTCKGWLDLRHEKRGTGRKQASAKQTPDRLNANDEWDR